MPHSRSPRGFSRQSRRLTSWGVGPGSAVVTQFTANASTILGAGVVPGANGLTLVRTRGSLSAGLSSQDVVAAGFHCAFGIGMITDDAFGAGVFPDPLVEDNWDGWLYHRFFDLHALTATEADGSNAVSNFLRIEIDSKAMRKFVDGMTIFGALEVIEVGTAVMDVFFDSRMLFKLP